MSSAIVVDVLVIGGGLAGWRAAEAAVAAGRSVALVANGAGNSPEIHARNEDDYEQAAAAIRDTVRITEEAPAAHPLIYAAVTREGTRIMQ